ncbi:MAG: hypothetical protein AAF799_14810 [Myxococcota bacterium]
MPAILRDRRRRRPRYFDRRFLTARDLTRDQQYVALRQADLGQIGGSGVLSGLDVHSDARGAQLFLEPGVGVARSGEVVAVRERVRARVAHLPITHFSGRAVDSLSNRRPWRRRHGLFVLVARPVEYAREPTTAFPTGVSGERSLEDGEIAEATWLTLMPVPSLAPREVLRRGRARLAREVFLEGFDLSEGSDGLALAVVGLVGNRINWIDTHMVRRDVGGDGLLGLGIERRKNRLAFQRHYVDRIRDVVAERGDRGLGENIAAADEFDVLPPVGPLPRAALQAENGDLFQSFFPASIYTEVTVVPEDELSSFVSEGLVRAPIDLTVEPETLEAVPVLLIVPVPRKGLLDRIRRLQSGVLRSSLSAAGRPLARVRPFDGLSALRRKLMPEVADPKPLDMKAWRSALESATELWYMRRPQFAPVSAVVPRIPEGSLDSEPIEMLDGPARDHIEGAGEVERFNNLLSTVGEEVIAALGETLADSVFATPVFVTGLLAELAYVARRPRATGLLPEPPDAPRAPFFVESPPLDRVVLRPIELGDVQRVTLRYRAQGAVGGIALLGALGDFERAVLGQSVVLPEIGAWLSQPLGGFVTVGVVQQMLANADVDGLRGLAEGMDLRIARLFDESRSAPRLATFGAEPLLRLVWDVSAASFRESIDDALADLPLGESAVFTTIFLVKLIEIGWGLDIDTADEGRAFLDALAAWVPGTAFAVPGVPTLHPNGEVLADVSHVSRDLLVEGALNTAPETVSQASERLVDVGFPRPVVPTSEDAEALQLLALAAPGVTFLNEIATATDAALGSFATQAGQAVTLRHMLLMRVAVVQLSNS